MIIIILFYWILTMQR